MTDELTEYAVTSPRGLTTGDGKIEQGGTVWSDALGTSARRLLRAGWITPTGKTKKARRGRAASTGPDSPPATGQGPDPDGTSGAAATPTSFGSEFDGMSAAALIRHLADRPVDAEAVAASEDRRGTARSSVLAAIETARQESPL